MKGLKDPPTLEELTESVVELSERVARLEALIKMHERTFRELREEVRRYFWLWVGTIAVGMILKVAGLI